MTTLDPIIHSQARLKIMTVLCGFDDLATLSFTRLQKLTDLSAGNLSTHLGKLEAASYITQEKTFKGKTPLTKITLTPTGQQAYASYIIELKKLIDL